MIITLLALATLVATMFLILGNLRVVARDTYDVLASFTHRAHSEGQLVPSLAFCALWLMIFALSCF